MQTQDPQSTNQNQQPIQAQSSSDELSHITQEMYKKNFELADKNKTLAILRKLDEIILSSVTDISQIAKQVADVVTTEAQFKAVYILLNDNDSKELKPVALSLDPTAQIGTAELQKKLMDYRIPLSQSNHFLINTITEKQAQTTHLVSDVFDHTFSSNEIEVIQKNLSISLMLVYPLVIREESIGILVVCASEDETSLFQYQKDLISQLAGLVAVAIDNALLYKRIQDANQQLKQLDKMKDEFVSLASHELKTPMASIKSYLWFILFGGAKVGTLNDKQKMYAERAYNSVERLIKLVTDMLNMSRLEGGRIKLTLSSVDMFTLAKDVLTELSGNAQTRQVAVDLVQPEFDLEPVAADADRIKEVVINLIGNSLKFTPPGGKVTITFTKEDEHIKTSVTDTGKGITKEQMPMLFQKFGLIEGNYLTRSSASEGTGLGLYLSKSLIELHGGKMEVSSEGENKGATFSFTLPIFKQELVQGSNSEKSIPDRQIASAVTVV